MHSYTMLQNQLEGKSKKSLTRKKLHFLMNVYGFNGITMTLRFGWFYFHLVHTSSQKIYNILRHTGDGLPVRIIWLQQLSRNLMIFCVLHPSRSLAQQSFFQFQGEFQGNHDNLEHHNSTSPLVQIAQIYKAKHIKIGYLVKSLNEQYVLLLSMNQGCRLALAYP